MCLTLILPLVLSITEAVNQHHQKPLAPLLATLLQKLQKGSGLHSSESYNNKFTVIQAQKESGSLLKFLIKLSQRDRNNHVHYYSLKAHYFIK